MKTKVLNCQHCKKPVEIEVKENAPFQPGHVICAACNAQGINTIALNNGKPVTGKMRK